MKRRPRQHQSIHQRHRHTNRNAFTQSTQHSTCGGPMQIQSLSRAPIICGNHIRLPIHHKSHMANKRLIQDFENSFVVVRPALRQPPNLRPFSRCKCAHPMRLSAAIACAQEPIWHYSAHKIGHSERNEESLFDVQCFSDVAGFASPRTTRNPTYSGAARAIRLRIRRAIRAAADHFSFAIAR